MPHTFYYVVFFDNNHHDNYGMPIPFNSYTFFLEVNKQFSQTNVEIYAADDKTKVPQTVQTMNIQKIDVKEVCEDVFDILQALPVNKGLKYRRFF